MTLQLAARPDSPLARRLTTLAIGLALVGVGVALMIHGEIGVAPYDVLITGLAERTGIAIGIAAMLPPLVFASLGHALGGKVGPGTVLAVLLVGPILGLVLDALPETERLVPRTASFAGGFLLLAVGITAVIIAQIGSGPAEVLMLAIHDKGFDLARSRTAIEVTSVAVGWALGGQVGVGTAVVAVCVGPMLRQFLRWSGYRSERAGEAAVCAEPGA